MNLQRLTLILAALAIVLSASAQQPLKGSERNRFFSEVRNYKHRFLVKELDLTKEQEDVFFPVYDKMDDELMQINDETRDLERSVSEKADATDTELEAAATAVYKQKEREAKVEGEYFDRFKEVLTPRQLLRLKTAEKKFTQKLVRHHRKLQKD